jgi:hypothetical protein
MRCAPRLWVYRGDEVSICELPLMAAAPDLGLMNGRNRRVPVERAQENRAATAATGSIALR